jgi:hypothetical protein
MAVFRLRAWQSGDEVSSIKPGFDRDDWERDMSDKREPAPRNPIARDLRTPKYQQRIVTSKKVYKRQRQVREED